MKLHETIRNVYEKCLKPLLCIEILGHDKKWQRISSFNVTSKQPFFEVKTQSHSLLCTANHILICDDGTEVLAIDSLGKTIQTESGNEEVLSIQQTNIYDNAYDVSLPQQSDHLYYCNGMLSHNCVILDEFAFLPKNIADKLFTSMYPVVSSSKNGKFILVSTPNGTDNLYYDIWQQANSKEANGNLEGWRPFEMHWWDVPTHDEEWKKKQIAAIGATRFAQEFDNQFLAKADNKKLIPDDVLEKYRMKLSEYKTNGIKPKKQRIISQDQTELYEFDMWHEFKPTHTYLASADISEGIGSDSSVLYIWDVTDLSNIIMCAKFSSNTISLVQFAFVSHRILSLYGNPWLAAERNGVSAGMLDSLKITYGYKNIASENKKGEPGIYSHVQIKGKACLWARDMLTTQCFGFTIYDKDLVDELGIFVKKDTKGLHNVYHALPGPNSHDDHVLALIWALFVLNNERIQDYFIVVDTVTTEIGVVYAKYLQPMYEYNQTDISNLTSDPLYKEFLEFKNEAISLAKDVAKRFNDEDQHDIFKYEKPDDYFGDYDNDSWNNTPLNWNMNPNFKQNAQKPQLSLNGNNSSHMPTFYVF